MNDKHASTFWTFYRKTPMCHLNALRSLRLLTSLIPPWKSSTAHVYKLVRSQYIGAWEAIAGLPNLQSLLVTTNHAFVTSKDEIMRQADLILPMKVVQRRKLKHFDVVLHVSIAFFPRHLAATIRERKLLWECFEIETAAGGGGGDRVSAKLWDGMHPRCRLIAMNAAMKNAAVPRQALAERDLFAWIKQFGTASSGRAFYSSNAMLDAKQLRLYERWWPAAQHTREGSEGEIRKEPAEAAKNAVKEKYQHVKFAGQLKATDLREINHVMDLGSMDRAVRYFYRYPELPEGEEPPELKYFIAA
ncbi:hypothetical protein HK57_00236 [Aspergillus ustus]|uniref:Uncharacterized protein n=1 Tax=Aspergillus ustus TaxID=40382 RepID=A0A0C1E766_ASPUT|nr:hypothetical protein HK57_00236 [Aspergillus ustus]